MATFELVDQLAQMRNAFGGAPTSLQSYAPPQAPAAPDVSTAAPSGGGHYPGDGHAHAVSATGQLVPIGNFKFDGGVAPKFQALAKAFPQLRITSGYRSPEQNARAKGVKNSWHLKGRAADFVGSAADMQKAAGWARSNGAREVLVHNVGSGQHLHVAW